MLFYERRRKKDLKILIPEENVEKSKEQGIVINYDEDKKEYSKMVGYRESANNEAPNEIYKRVFEDNKQFTFESDIYSEEFFNFLLQVLTSVA